MFHAVARITKSSTVYAAEKKYSLGISCVTAASASATERETTAKSLLLIGRTCPPDRAHAAQHAHGEHQPDELAPDRRLHRLDHDEKGAGDARGSDREGEGELLDAHGIHAHQAQRELVLRDREHRPAEERAREK